jgi:hypothetical protein
MDPLVSLLGRAGETAENRLRDQSWSGFLELGVVVWWRFIQVCSIP